MTTTGSQNQRIGARRPRPSEWDDGLRRRRRRDDGNRAGVSKRRRAGGIRGFEPLRPTGTQTAQDNGGVFVYDRSGATVTAPAQLEDEDHIFDQRHTGRRRRGEGRAASRDRNNPKYTFQWERCDAARTLCNAITGQNSKAPIS